ncbi:MAG: hypothetical protein QXP31_07825 [Pyrobaculum sp.]
MERQSELQKSFEPLVDLLAELAREKVYGPLDLLSRVEDSDEFYMRLAREALYSALRYYSTSGRPVQNLEAAVEQALRIIERRPYFAKELALKALAKAMSTETEKSGGS